MDKKYKILRIPTIQLTFMLNKFNPLLIQFQILRSGEKRSSSMSIVPEVGEILQDTPKTIQSNLSLHIFTLNLLPIHIQSTLIQRESTTIHCKSPPFLISVNRK